MTEGIHEHWDPAPGYLNASTLGLPPRVTVAALHRGLDEWHRGEATATGYDDHVTAARAAYGHLLGVDVDRVAIGAQVSALVATAATALPASARVIVPEGEFTSVTGPFQARTHHGTTVVPVPLRALAEAVTKGCDAVAFSLAQSATGELVDAAATVAAARAVDALVICDATQAVGWLPIDANQFDITVCAAYKWLCSPRGSAFMTVTPDVAQRMTPILAGWYAGDDPWTSVYSHIDLAATARRFDTSPAWLAWLGTRTSLELFAAANAEDLRHHGSDLADALLTRLDLAPAGRPVLTLDDPDQVLARALYEAGAAVSVRAGRVRIGFHVWNTADDVELLASCLSERRTRRVRAGAAPP